MKQFIFPLFIFLFFSMPAVAQVADTAVTAKDSAIALQPIKVTALQTILGDNIFINLKTPAVAQAIQPRKAITDDVFFYILLVVVCIFGVSKAAYSKYFANVFRVFFNSSLRQSQLTDQLVQDQLPSLIFNALFVISSALYVYFLLRFYNMSSGNADIKLMLSCIIGVAVIYFAKYLVLKFTGWITGFKQEADIYTFIIFLINKIIGICLLPVVIVLAFANPNITNIFVILSFAIVGLLLIMRFFRSYGLLQTKIKVSRFHFFLYIFSIEVLPLFIIYKVVMLFFNRNL